MRTLNGLIIAALVACTFSVSNANAALCGASQCAKICTPAPRKSCWHTVTKTKTRVVYDTVTETKKKTVYDTVCEEKTVNDVKRIAEIRFRTEEFEYERPVYESVSSEVPYTVHRTVYDTVTKEVPYVSYVPSYEQRTRSVPYTTCRKITETLYRSKTCCVPRQIPYTKTVRVMTGRWETRVVDVPGKLRKQVTREPGCWQWDPCKCRCVFVLGAKTIEEVRGCPKTVCKRVWVPCMKEKEVCGTTTVYDTHIVKVPYKCTREIPEVCTKEVEYTVCKMYPVTKTERVCYKVAKQVAEERTRTETQVVQKMVKEKGERKVPYTHWIEIPLTRKVTESKPVARQVEYTVKKCVPRTEEYQICVRVFAPLPCSKAKCESATNSDSAENLAMSSTPPTRLRDGDFVIGLESTSNAGPIDSRPAFAARQARSHFESGLTSFWQGQYEEALVEFDSATKAAPSQAKYAYFHALALYGAGREADALTVVAAAVELEQDTRSLNWGRMMERVQGNPRLWIESARKRMTSEA